MDSPTEATPKPPRRWRTISVRALLLLVLAIGVPTGWWARQAHLQGRAVAAVEAADGSVIYGHEVIDGDGNVTPSAKRRQLLATLKASGTILSPRVATGRPPAPAPEDSFKERARRSLGVDYVDTVVQVWAVDSRKIKDADLAHLADLPQLERLMLGNTPIGDAGLAHLAGLKNLKVLFLNATKVTDAGLGHLADLDRLEELGLAHNGAAITDAGLARLVGLKRLRVLEVGGPKLTDDGLRSLERLPALEHLLLFDASEVTTAGIDRLRKALPNLKVQRLQAIR